jgi:hypothetical protein
VAADETSTDFEAKLLEASEKRVHQTKTLVQLWDKHGWPNNDIILSLFHEIPCRIDIDPSVVSECRKRENPEEIRDAGLCPEVSRRG